MNKDTFTNYYNQIKGTCSKEEAVEHTLNFLRYLRQEVKEKKGIKKQYPTITGKDIYTKQNKALNKYLKGLPGEIAQQLKQPLEDLHKSYSAKSRLETELERGPRGELLSRMHVDENLQRYSMDGDRLEEYEKDIRAKEKICNKILKQTAEGQAYENIKSQSKTLQLIKNAKQNVQNKKCVKEVVRWAMKKHPIQLGSICKKIIVQIDEKYK